MQICNTAIKFKRRYNQISERINISVAITKL